MNILSPASTIKYRHNRECKYKTLRLEVRTVLHEKLISVYVISVITKIISEARMSYTHPLYASLGGRQASHPVSFGVLRTMVLRLEVWCMFQYLPDNK